MALSARSSRRRGSSSHVRTHRVLEGRDGVDELGRDTPPAQILQHRRQRVDAHTTIVHGYADDLRLSASQQIDNVLERMLLHEHGIAG